MSHAKPPSGGFFASRRMSAGKTLLHALEKSRLFAAETKTGGLSGCDIVTFSGAYCDMLRTQV
ncbi:hypothetical protein [Burkholderia glumae]|uniref:Uncharacterized protein n=1 Tax=Burkholderia glumae TaxID=337 RepID=A0AAP9Y4R6_BURGL|nr:hypothetical protein [Burkholderia glumae]MCM2483062.1 hypothetical protein [Burkholderia glumae]MCM2493488.1 hypothetical protein [Burkholderia glumae]MCM2506378.1 hypothetical protein [Burkholderia glumae]MCM2538034.1 hypothetical protein [Burkholderia glumae]MCM2543952.1 hypothetical protein [Burkholderia glumae]